MESSPDEIIQTVFKRYAEYKKTLNDEQRLACQAEIDRIAASGERKFDHEKTNNMSQEERANFFNGLSMADFDLYRKECDANSQIVLARADEVRANADFKPAPIKKPGISPRLYSHLPLIVGIIGIITLILVYIGVAALLDSHLDLDENTVYELLAGVMVAVFIIGSIVWYVIKKLGLENADISWFSRRYGPSLQSPSDSGIPLSFQAIYGILAFAIAGAVWTVSRYPSSDSKDFALKAVGGALLSGLIIGVIIFIFRYVRKKRVERICRECGFTLTDKSFYDVTGINVFGYQSFLRGYYVSSSVYENISLNLPGQRAYSTAVKYDFDSIFSGRAGSIAWSKLAQALVFESPKNLPYIKIAPKSYFFMWPNLFYKPSDAFQGTGIKIGKGYKLYCAPENEQYVSEILPEVLPLIKKCRFAVEINGNWIVVAKLGYTIHFDKFVNQALPIAQAFDRKEA